MRGMMRKSAERGGVSRRERTVVGLIANELYHSFTALGRDGQVTLMQRTGGTTELYLRDGSDSRRR